jgi:hypothetical protein
VAPTARIARAYSTVSGIAARIAAFKFAITVGERLFHRWDISPDQYAVDVILGVLASRRLKCPHVFFEVNLWPELSQSKCLA